jgi:hypothetical protein
VGEHNSEIYSADLGLREDELKALQRKGIV